MVLQIVKIICERDEFIHLNWHVVRLTFTASIRDAVICLK